MDGYTKAAIREAMIAKGKDPDAPPWKYENAVLTGAAVIFSIFLYGGLGWLIYHSIAGR